MITDLILHFVHLPYTSRESRPSLLPQSTLVMSMWVLLSAVTVLQLVSATPTGTLIATNRVCQGCRKDLHAGSYQGCSFSGSFPRQTSVNHAQCLANCIAEPGCNYYVVHFGAVCNLHLVQNCVQQSAGSGDLFEMEFGPPVCPSVLQPDPSEAARHARVPLDLNCTDSDTECTAQCPEGYTTLISGTPYTCSRDSSGVEDWVGGAFPICYSKY